MIPTEAGIRADERRLIREAFEVYACEYVEKWTPLIGADQAKADAWNILVAARRVTEQQSEKRDG